MSEQEKFVATVVELERTTATNIELLRKSLFSTQILLVAMISESENKAAIMATYEKMLAEHEVRLGEQLPRVAKF